MPLTEAIRSRIIQLYCTFFFFILLFKYFNAGFLYQLDPVFFTNKLDVSTWLVQLTGLPQLLIANNALCLVADLCFAFFPFIYLYTYKRHPYWSVLAAVLLLLFHFIYSLLSWLFLQNSIEQLVAFILFPLLFIPKSLSTFWFLLQGLRYFFLFFFFSAGVWKFVQGGIFNEQQMSGILIIQHKELLINLAGKHLQINFYKWLIENPMVGYMLYVTSTLIELFFIIGFFTKKLDYTLLILFLLFLVMDAVVMRIHYWETLPFIITLLFSRYKLPEEKAP